MMDLEILRHSVSHVMAQAVRRLYPDVKLAIGPAVSDGFYYDLDSAHAFTQEDLSKIEAEMAKIVQENLPFEKIIVPKSEAEAYFEKNAEQFKIEILKDIHDEKVSLYKDGEFTDLCRGPHVSCTGDIKAFKLLSVAGAYWRGDEKNKMLQRIYGTAFETKEELDAYLKKMEEARLRDHRKIGRELDLFSVQDKAGPGLIFWHPKGAMVRHLIESFWRQTHIRRGYDIIYIPHISKIDLWKTSGHLDYYMENMYSPIDIDEVQYMLKPMNCPGHILIYKSSIHSYAELPIRYAELGTVYRYERSGVLHGLMRVRGFTQDDAHIFCTPEQLKDEVKGVISLTRYMMKTFGFDYKVYLSTRPEKSSGSDDEWLRATAALEESMKETGMQYKVDPGEGVFYGPKIDFKMVDSIGREWQGPTIQVDFNNPSKFDVTYRGSDGADHRAVMIHRTVLGSMERFFGVLTEHYAGAFPFWLAPEQVRLIPIKESNTVFARTVKETFLAKGIRAHIDARNEKLGKKIRDAELEKIPYMAVIGDNEAAAGSISLRKKGEGDLGKKSIAEALALFETLNNPPQDS